MTEEEQMTDQQKEELHDQFRQSELRWRSDIQDRIDSLLRGQEEFREWEIARKLKYDGFIDTMIDREKKRMALWDAIIQKSIVGLCWAGIVAVGALIVSGIKSEAADLAQWVRGGK